jgi:hypothetical protein
MAKNIVILSDGTGQEGGKGHDTNVYKLFRMLEDRTEDQIVFYDQGLGTDWRKISGNAFGVGFSKNIVQCYDFIFENYTAGDKIFLLGFSRGAATVRSLASFIHHFGILAKSQSTLIRRAYQIYKTLREDKSHKANQFSTAHPNMWAEIEFLGVWDTVPALGVVPLAGLNLLLDRLPGLKHGFHDFTLHPSVKNAYQALSIDDDRAWFFPTIWNQYSDETRQKIKQVWFSGSHTDVGGGFVEAGLSDLALEWMVQSAVSHGIRLYLKSRKYWNFCIAPDATDLFHPPRQGWGRAYKAGVRDEVWDKKAVDTFGPPIIHESVLERARRDSNYRPWILKNYGSYPDPEKWLREHRKNYLHLKYEDELNRRYQDWCTEKWRSGEQNLPNIDAWLVVYPFSYEQWLNENPLVEKTWMEKYDTFVEEFQDKKYLVNRDKMADLRDYDKNTIDEKYEQVHLDRHVNDNLWERAMNNNRIEYDRIRWSKTKDEKNIKPA